MPSTDGLVMEMHTSPATAEEAKGMTGSSHLVQGSSECGPQFAASASVRNLGEMQKFQLTPDLTESEILMVDPEVSLYEF